MEEIFKTVEGFEDYQVSNLGRVVSNKKGKPRFLKPQQDAVGYLHVRLYKEGDSLGSYSGNRGKRPKLYKVHRLVAETFIPQQSSEETLHVNHINGDKQDNRVDNLEWLSHADNIKHSWDNGLRDNAAWKAAEKRYRPVEVITPDGKVYYHKARKYVVLDLGINPLVVVTSIRKNRPVKKGAFKGYQFFDSELPPGETYKKILDIEAKLLDYRKIQNYFKEKNRIRREQQRKNKK